MLPGAFSEHSLALLWDASCCFASSCQKPQAPGMLMHLSIYFLPYWEKQGGSWRGLKNRVGWGLALWVWARLLQGWIESQRSSGIIQPLKPEWHLNWLYFLNALSKQTCQGTWSVHQGSGCLSEWELCISHPLSASATSNAWCLPWLALLTV